MKFTPLEIDGMTMALMYLIGAAVGWAIFYYTIKAAVKWGTIEAHAELKSVVTALTPAQSELQKKYDKGEITIEEYKKQWDA